MSHIKLAVVILGGIALLYCVVRYGERWGE